MAQHQVGDYEILEALGQGAAGIAYRARQVHTDEPVALKLLVDQVANDQAMQQRFVREASVAEKLDHPGIVRFRECGVHDGQLFIAMELVDSGSLDDVLAEGGALPWREACEVAAQACDALAHAHDRGVVHRDLKPANLFLTSDGQVKIGDFGLARDADRHRLTLDGQTVGTCRYMAPEQVRGDDQLTGAVDMYAIGCLLHMMTTNDCPFTGETVVEVFEHHLFTPAPALSCRCPNCPPALDKLVARLLAKEAADRPGATEARDTLQSIIEGREVAPLAVASEASRDEPIIEPNLTERLKANAKPAKPTVSTARLAAAAAVVAAIALVALLASRG
ncbi:Serine/threonine-protein kinase StkP [Posidoniimonas polymericola]|uniref:Serine/threonine-protein kinase StkP n=1 Tax=Posidoniimonas polymericola TaxID=2528002 RepID=A0A5C5YL19_9BACT|nr:serine/threonine-protein kinase [Posidoniimonas polymericola]TWT75551.1 Serine/threonine-protein kinase StkP [Posidoniimonas polymericola]